MSPLVFEWSGSRVRAFDLATRESRASTTIYGAIGKSFDGREAVVAVAQRSVFIRTLRVPPLSHKELSRIILLEISPLLPLPASEFVIGFRLGAAVAGQGRIAVVAAIKTDVLRRIHEDAGAAGLKVKAVVPLAFGSWLAAKSHGLDQCAVVQTDGASLMADVIDGGELCYSRSVPMPDSREDLADEMLCTFETAGVAPSRILSLGDPLPVADVVDPKDGLDYLTNWPAIEKRLVKFELPESTKARQQASLRMVAQRALVAAVAALALTGLAVVRQRSRLIAEGLEKASISRRLADANKQDSIAKSSESAALDDANMIGIAFHPAQSFGDIVLVTTHAVPANASVTGISIERGKLVLIRGEAVNDATVAKYVDGLSVDPRFRSVRLVFANRATTGKKTVIRFAISLHAIGNLPLGGPTKGGKSS